MTASYTCAFYSSQNKKWENSTVLPKFPGILRKPLHFLDNLDDLAMCF